MGEERLRVSEKRNPVQELHGAHAIGVVRRQVRRVAVVVGASERNVITEDKSRFLTSNVDSNLDTFDRTCMNFTFKMRILV